MVVEILEALVFVLSTLEIDPRLLQFLLPQARIRFRFIGGAASASPDAALKAFR